MRVPLAWLRDYVEIDLEPERLAERLTLLGMQVTALESWGEEWQSVVVGELLAVERHPRAERLSLARVTVGDGEPLDIVCGATNIAPGQRVPVALPGATLPGGRRIERTERMGVVSNGMLCSGDELQLTADADGILILPPDSPLGVPLSDLFGDVVLHVDVKPNRGDGLSLVGLAREVSLITGAPIREPEVDLAEGADEARDRLAVTVLEPALCPRFVGRWVHGVQVAPSPDRIQMRLRAAGMRPVSNVVDATNYVMLEMGKPIHAFDAAPVGRDQTGQARLVVRRARPGERLETLDHVDRALDEETLVIADENQALAIAGVMGGAASEVSQSTLDVIIESAIFDPVSIRRTGQRYALRSEASLRFEKGQETRLARLGADRCARLVVEWSGGTIAAGRVDTAPDEPSPRRVAFRPDRVARLLGLSLDSEEQRAVLARVNVATEPAVPGTPIQVAAGSRAIAVAAGVGDALLATVPTWRRDIVIEADVAEEIARVHGYEEIPPTLPDTPPPAWRGNPLELRLAVRETLVGAGLVEVVSHALVSTRHLTSFAWSASGDVAAGERAAGGAAITVLNPLSPEHAVLRQGLLASLADVVSTNVRHGRTDVAIFEIGKGYGRDDDRPREWWRLGIALTGSRDVAAWNRPARPADLDDAKGLVELLAVRLGLSRPTWSPLADEPILHPGRAARVAALGTDGRLGIAGVIGELHPAVLERLELRTGRVLVAELSIAGLSGGTMPVVRSNPIPRHPAAERDLAVVVGEAVTAAAVDAIIRTAGGSLLAGSRLFDIYRGAPLGPNDKSLAIRLVFQAADRTLTDAEIDRAVAVISGALSDGLGARLRT